MGREFRWLFMNLRIIRYVESTDTPGQVGHIVCEYKGSTLRVRVTLMSNQDRITEFNFGNPEVLDQNIIITVRYGRGVPEFVHFMPELNQPSQEAKR